MDKITEQREWVKKLRENIPKWEQEHKEALKREGKEFKEKIRRLSSYHSQLMMVVKEQLKKEEKRLAEMLASAKCCEACGEEVELRSSTGSTLHSDSLYICKSCGHIQEEYIEK
jgi:predicted RNA-binding Zn-ribbon protein involved in translation (DUF1610 family)